MKRLIALLSGAMAATPVLALDPMPKEPGLSGYVNAGIGTGSIESNFLARVAGIDLDLGDQSIDDFGSPEGESITTVVFNLNLTYTFADLKTQVSLGNDLADFLQFDRSTRFSLRHDFDRLGRLQVSLVSSAFPRTEVWEDPYIQGAPRQETERDSTGGRVTWDKILGSRFELKLESRSVELDEERSGEALGLDDADRALLDREGDVIRAEIGYLANLDGGTHLVRPHLAWIDRDLDGAAMAQDGYEVGLSWLYNNRERHLRWANNITYSKLEADAVNPVFGRRDDADSLGLASQAFFPGLFGLRQWEPNVTLAWGESDSDIDFNDGKGWLVSLGIGRTF